MRELQLTKGKVALVDDEDYDKVCGYKWTTSKIGSSYYAYRRETITRKMIYLHRELLDAPIGKFVDHINGDGLDNRRANLRLCSRSQNYANARTREGCSSKYKGVTLRNDTSKWMARIGVNKTYIHIGCYESEVKAAEAYNRYAKYHFGEFARLNILEEE